METVMPKGPTAKLSCVVKWGNSTEVTGVTRALSQH